MEVMLIESGEIFREGLAKILESGPKHPIVIKCSNANEACERSLKVKPDIIIMDIEKDNGFPETIKRLKVLIPTTKVAILTYSEKELDLFKAMQAGASAYLSKDIKIDELTSDIDHILDGEVIISPPMSTKLLSEFAFLEKNINLINEHYKFALSDREKEVLSLVAHGLSNKEIARSLFMSENTARVHLHKIIKKLGTHNRLEAAVLGIQSKTVE